MRLLEIENSNVNIEVVLLVLKILKTSNNIAEIGEYKYKIQRDI